MEVLTRWLLENPGLSVSISAKPGTDVYGVPVFEVTMDDLRPVEASKSKRLFTTHLDVLYTNFGPDFRGTLDRMKEYIELWEEKWQ